MRLSLRMTAYITKSHAVEAWQFSKDAKSAPWWVTEKLLRGEIQPVNGIGGSRGEMNQLRVYTDDKPSERVIELGDWLLMDDGRLGAMGKRAFDALYEALPDAAKEPKQ